MLPINYLGPCVWAISQLAADDGCSAVLCTATQPSSYPDFEKKFIDGSYFNGFNSEIEIQLQEVFKNKND